MASTKNTGTLHLLLLGLLVAEQTIIVSPNDTTMAQSSTGTPTPTPEATSSNSSTMSASTQPSTVMDNNHTATTAAHSTVSTTNGGTVTTTHTQSLTSTSEGTTSNSTLSATSTSRDTSSNTAFTSISTQQHGSNTMSLSSTMSSSSTTSLMASSSHGMAVATTNATSMNTLCCPSFLCSYSECYSMYTSQNATECVDTKYCQLMRCADMLYNVSCSASCAESCNSTSQINCSVNCCNSTRCLNGTFASMMMTTKMPMTTTSTTQSSSTMTSTTADKGNKCKKGTCSGDTCYTAFKANPAETCSSSQQHCQLKKETKDSTVMWTAGCANCKDENTCKGSTQPPCVLECCNVTITSCLKLDGTINVLSFATRGPHLHTELIVSLLCLLSISLLL